MKKPDEKQLVRVLFSTEGANRPRQAGFNLVELLVVIAIIGILASILLPSLSRAKALARKTHCISNVKQLSTAWFLYTSENNDYLPPNGIESHKEFDGYNLWVSGGTHLEKSTFTNKQALIGKELAAFARYIPSPEIYKCPSDKSTITIKGVEYPKVRSYGLNSFMGLSRLSVNSTNHLTFHKGADLGLGSPADYFTFLDMTPESLCFAAFVVYMTESDVFFHYPGKFHKRGSTIAFADGHVGSKQWTDPRTLESDTIYHYGPSPGNKDLEWLQRHASRWK